MNKKIKKKTTKNFVIMAVLLAVTCIIMVGPSSYADDSDAATTGTNYTHTLNFNANGGTGAPANITVTTTSSNESMTIPTTTPTKSGSIFAGWNTSSLGIGTSYKPGDKVPVGTNAVTLYAQWNSGSFKMHMLIFDANGGTGAPATLTKTTTTLTESMTIPSTIPTKSGYAFACWNTNPAGTGTSYYPGDKIPVGASVVTLYAKWGSSYTHTLNFDANGGTGAPATMKVTTASSTESMTIPTAKPTKSGYSFVGWYTNANGTGTSYNPGDKIPVGTSAVTLYAKWTLTTYTHTLNFNANGGTGAPANITVTTTSSNESMTIPTTVPTKNGYTFSGWSTKSTGIGGGDYKPGDKIPVGTSTVTLYAQWKSGLVNTYMLVFDANGGTGAPSTMTTSSSSSTSVSMKIPSTIPTKSNYTFASWNTISSGTGTSYKPGDTISVGKSAVTLYAQWGSSYVHTLNFDANGGTGAPATMKVTTTLSTESMTIPPAKPTKSGYSFVGWYTNANGTGASYNPGDKIPVGTSAVTLYAKWTLTTYTHTLNFNANGGTGAPANITVTTTSSNESMTIPTTVPTKSGYNFASWSTNSAGIGGGAYKPGGEIQVGTSAVTLYAQWNVVITHTLTLRFDANGGTGAPATQTSTSLLTSGAFMITSKVPTKEGYDFAGWYTNPNGTGTSYKPGSLITVGISEVILYAKWTLTPTYAHTLNFDANGGTGAPATMKVTTTSSNESMTIPTAKPTKNGYEFVGWYTNANGTGTSYNPGDKIPVGTSAVTLYAAWIKTYTHTLSFSANGGTGAPATMTVTTTLSTEQMAIPTTVPTRNGYYFIYWNTSSNGTGVSYDPGSYIPVESTQIQLYAVWGSAHTLSFNANGGVGAPSAQTVITASTTLIMMEIPETKPTRNGYLFSCWNDKASGSGVSYKPGDTIYWYNLSTLTLYAQWDVSYTHTLNFNVNGGTGAPATQKTTTIFAIDSMMIPTAVPTRSGYDFVGWNTNPNGTGTFHNPSGEISVGTSAITLYAMWTLTTYTHTLNFNANGGTGAPANITVTSTSSKESITIPTTVPTKSGYNFASWSTNSTGIGGGAYKPGGEIQVGTSAVTLYAQWNVAVSSKHTLNFNASGGTGAPASMTISSLSPTTQMTIPTAEPTRSGFNFIDWNTNPAGTGLSYKAGDKISVGTSAVTLYAQWGYTHTLNFDANGGTGAPATLTATTISLMESTNIPLSVPTKSGYKFVCWNTNPNGTGFSYKAGDKISVGTSAVTLYAVWAVNNDDNPNFGTITTKADVTFTTDQRSFFTGQGSYNAVWSSTTPTNYEWATINSSPQGVAGANVWITGTAPTVAGTYNITGTVGSGNGNPYPYTFTLVLTVTGTNYLHTLNFNANGGTGAPDNMVLTTTSYVQSIKIPTTEPKRSNYEFYGWYTNPAGTGTSYKAGDTIDVATTTVTLYARWTMVACNLTATSDSNSMITPSGKSTVPAGSSQTFTFSAKEGYSILSVKVDGVALTRLERSLGQYTFSNITSDHTIEVKSIIPGGISSLDKQWMIYGSTYDVIYVWRISSYDVDNVFMMMLTESYSGFEGYISTVFSGVMSVFIPGYEIVDAVIQAYNMVVAYEMWKECFEKDEGNGVEVKFKVNLLSGMIELGWSVGPQK